MGSSVRLATSHTALAVINLRYCSFLFSCPSCLPLWIKIRANLALMLLRVAVLILLLLWMHHIHRLCEKILLFFIVIKWLIIDLSACTLIDMKILKIICQLGELLFVLEIIRRGVLLASFLITILNLNFIIFLDQARRRNLILIRSIQSRLLT